MKRFNCPPEPFCWVVGIVSTRLAMTSHQRHPSASHFQHDPNIQSDVNVAFRRKRVKHRTVDVPTAPGDSARKTPVNVTNSPPPPQDGKSHQKLINNNYSFSFYFHAGFCLNFSLSLSKKKKKERKKERKRQKTQNLIVKMKEDMQGDGRAGSH